LPDGRLDRERLRLSDHHVFRPRGGDEPQGPAAGGERGELGIHVGTFRTVPDHLGRNSYSRRVPLPGGLEHDIHLLGDSRTWVTEVTPGRDAAAPPAGGEGTVDAQADGGILQSRRGDENPLGRAEESAPIRKRLNDDAAAARSSRNRRELLPIRLHGRKSGAADREP
jgi:hypothetical protein